ncbi:MAG: hypothetical protein LQ338_001253 [Usnochroma carphineum]|nr:MAG: hypothetical protein LQ338_001253 [Usnochroma carphineum]
MLLLALTGSLATGKSTVSTILSSPPHSLPIIDADVLARKVVEPGTRGYDRIVAHFGPTTPDLLLSSPTSTDTTNHDAPPQEKRPLNRAALGRRVFGSTPSRIHDRKILNSIVHPAVRYEILKSILWHYITNSTWAIVLDIPLLYDSGLDIFTPVILMVACSPSTQLSRLRARDAHLSEVEARDRIASQGGVEAKVRRTEARGEGRGYVVWNDGTVEELQAEVGRVMREVERGRKEGWWRFVSWLCWPVGVGWGLWEVWRGWRERRRWEGEERREQKKKGE